MIVEVFTMRVWTVTVAAIVASVGPAFSQSRGDPDRPLASADDVVSGGPPPRLTNPRLTNPIAVQAGFSHAFYPALTQEAPVADRPGYVWRHSRGGWFQEPRV